jgi:hypothetical protein
MNPTITIDTNDNLIISIQGQPKEDFEEIREHLESHGSDSTLAFLLEDYACNGGYTFFNAGDANPFVGLTEAPCIAEEMSVDENGKNSILGEFWYFNNYMLECPIEKLLNKGSVVFTNYR